MRKLRLRDLKLSHLTQPFPVENISFDVRLIWPPISATYLAVLSYACYLTLLSLFLHLLIGNIIISISWDSEVRDGVSKMPILVLAQNKRSLALADVALWALAYGPKGRWFNSQSGHMPWLWARFPVGGTWEATTHWCFCPSLSPSLPLSKNK